MVGPARTPAMRAGEDAHTLTDLLGEAGALLVALDGDTSQIGSELALELNRIAETIAQTRTEIRQIGTADISGERIPRAGRELDEVVRATEDATNRIMAAAETILGADSSDSDAYHSLVTDNVMEIFEACSFQDITGQRVSKVVKTLQTIEERIGTIAETLGLSADASSTTDTDEHDDRSEREKALLLHGPALTGEGVAQTEVDEMIADGDSGAASQADIDALFD